jgi:hypothetical protein
MSNSSATSSADVIPTYDGGGEMQTMGESQDLMIQQIQNSVFRALNENSYTPQMQTQQVQQQQFVPQMQTQQVQQQQFVPQMQTQQVKPKNVKLPSDEELMKMNSIYTNVALSLNPTTSLKTENENPFKSDPMIQKIKNIKYSESDINEMNNLFKNTTQMNVVLPSKPDLSQLKSVSN